MNIALHAGIQRGEIVMKVQIERLIAVQEALLSHSRWLAGLQASPFTPPELDGNKAAVAARQLNPDTVPDGFCAEDFDAECELAPTDGMRKTLERWD